MGRGERGWSVSLASCLCARPVGCFLPGCACTASPFVRCGKPSFFIARAVGASVFYRPLFRFGGTGQESKPMVIGWWQPYLAEHCCCVDCCSCWEVKTFGVLLLIFGEKNQNKTNPHLFLFAGKVRNSSRLNSRCAFILWSLCLFTRFPGGGGRGRRRRGRPGRQRRPFPSGRRRRQQQ